MNNTVICSFIGNDKNGLVELLAKAISDSDGNWLESNMAKLAGHFAGIICIDIDESKIANLQSALDQLAKDGLAIQLSNSSHAFAREASSQSAAQSALQLDIIGNDRPGIVYEVSQALVAAKINVVNMQTHLSSAPMSGDSLFHSTMSLSNEHDYDLDELEFQLDKIAERLSVEIDLGAQDE
ncbi:MAG: ACT domain-containing protein [Pseudomonadales bacterium]|nr:ACT domain-containing protein [Pseudomonadales bacterium]